MSQSTFDIYIGLLGQSVVDRHISLVRYHEFPMWHNLLLMDTLVWYCIMKVINGAVYHWHIHWSDTLSWISCVGQFTVDTCIGLILYHEYPVWDSLLLTPALV